MTICGENRFSCKICDMKFNTNSHLMRHNGTRKHLDNMNSGHSVEIQKIKTKCAKNKEEIDELKKCKRKYCSKYKETRSRLINMRKKFVEYVKLHGGNSVPTTDDAFQKYVDNVQKDKMPNCGINETNTCDITDHWADIVQMYKNEKRMGRVDKMIIELTTDINTVGAEDYTDVDYKTIISSGLVVGFTKLFEIIHQKKSNDNLRIVFLKGNPIFIGVMIGNDKNANKHWEIMTVEKITSIFINKTIDEFNKNVRYFINSPKIWQQFEQNENYYKKMSTIVHVKMASNIKKLLSQRLLTKSSNSHIQEIEFPEKINRCDEYHG
jgi:hypothetical protein